MINTSPHFNTRSRTFVKKKMRFLFVLTFLIWHYYSYCTDYYIHSEAGSDRNPGTEGAPWQTLSNLQDLSLNPGDNIMLAAGQMYHGAIVLKDMHGNANAPIRLTSYFPEKTADSLATVDALSFSNGIHLINCSYILVESLRVQADGGRGNDEGMRCGIKVEATGAQSTSHIKMRNLHIRNIFYHNPGLKRGKKEVQTANGTQAYGWGIRVISNKEGASIAHVAIEGCVVENVAHTGIKFTGGKEKIRDVQVTNCSVKRVGGPGLQFSLVEDLYVARNYVSHSGNSEDGRMWGRGSGLWTWGTHTALIEHNHLMYAQGPGDSAGAHIDFNCKDVILQYNFSAFNAGGFCEVLGNNRNCAYRYNISFNDGSRQKGIDGAFQDGKIFWLSGYVGNNQERVGPYNTYFYNNTIYLSDSIESKIAISPTASGILIANNIFYVGKSRLVMDDQSKWNSSTHNEGNSVIFSNNLYQQADSWPSTAPIQDSEPIIDADMFGIVSTRLNSFIPKKGAKISNKGIEIHRIPGDAIGLKDGLNVSQDILGNPIDNLPDIGAIEWQESFSE